jgi:predicted secreted hydrolase
MAGATRLAGLMIYPDGSRRYLASSDFVIGCGGGRVPHRDAYPAGWDVTISSAALDRDADLQFSVNPLIADQELYDATIVYWEGVVRIEGDVTGYGYAELTGYDDPITGRF